MYYLGMDAGGTKTLAVICDRDGHEVARGTAGGGNHQVNRRQAEESIYLAVDRALNSAGLVKEQITAAVYGLAGADRETDFKILRPMLAGVGIEKHDIVCDTVVALRAGTHQPDGIVCICGTGTNCLGVNSRKEVYQCGGFSYAFGDWGGGGSLAVEVFRSVMRQWDGRDTPTLLTQLMLEHMGYETVQAVYDDYLDQELHPPRDLAQLLFQAAGQYDPVALDILKKQGEELGLAAQAVARRLGMEGDAFDVVLAGSVVTRGDQAGHHIRPHIAARLHKTAPKARLVTLHTEPAMGGLLLAMELDGIVVGDYVYANMEKTLKIS